MKVYLKVSLPLGALLFFILPGQVQAALQYVGGAEAAGTSAAFNISLTGLTGGSASAAAANDLVIISAGYAKATGDLQTGVSTAGFVSLNHLTRADTVDASFSVSWKIMTATPDTTVSCNGSGATTDVAVCTAHVWRYVNTATPFDVASTSAVAANTGVPDSPSITPSTSGAVVISTGLGASAASITEVTAPAGYGNTVSANPASDPGNVARIGTASKAWTSGAEDPAAWVGFDSTNTGSWVAFTLALRPAFAPTVTTQEESSVTQTSATVNGNITDTGGIAPTVRGFAWGTNSALSGGDTATTTENGTFETGAFTGSLSSLTCGTTYYSRPYAINTIGTGLGTIDSFTTSSCVSAPTVTTNFANVGATTAVLNGTKTGGDDATEHGFAYSTDAALSTGVSTTTLGALASNSSFSSNIGSLSVNTTYYFRAYGTNAAGTAYGIIKSFLTGNSNVTRKMLLFQGFKIKLTSGKIILHQK